MEGFIRTGPNQFTYREKGRFVQLEIDGDNIHFEDGPEDMSARRHEAMGGSQNIAEFIANPYPWIDDYPGLHQELCKYL